jgi:enoyl reductase-like protein
MPPNISAPFGHAIQVFSGQIKNLLADPSITFARSHAQNPVPVSQHPSAWSIQELPRQLASKCFSIWARSRSF